MHNHYISQTKTILRTLSADKTGIIFINNQKASCKKKKIIKIKVDQFDVPCLADIL